MTTRGSRATEDELAAFPLRYEVGDEVEVGLDGRSSLYPYDQGWGEGTIIKVHPLVSEFPKGAFRGMDASRLGAAVPYMVQLKEGKKIVPCPIDDPDFIRAKGAKYQTGAPTRFKVGDSVECKIGPDDWIPGTVRALWQPYPGWGRGWRQLGMFGYERDPRQTPDCCPYHVTPDGKRFDGKVVGSTNIMVPADNDGYIRTSAKFRDRAAADAIEAANATNAVPEITFRTRVREAGLFRIALSAKGAKPNLPMQSNICPTKMCWPAATALVPNSST